MAINRTNSGSICANDPQAHTAGAQATFEIRDQTEIWDQIDVWQDPNLAWNAALGVERTENGHKVIDCFDEGGGRRIPLKGHDLPFGIYDGKEVGRHRTQSRRVV